MVTAPTGCGKTLTSFLWTIHQFASGNWETGQTKPFLDRMVMEGMDVGYLISGIPSPPECLQMMRQSVGHGKKTDYLSKDLRILAIKEYCLIIISHLEDID